MRVPATQSFSQLVRDWWPLLCFVWVFGDGSVPKHTRHIPLASVARCCRYRWSAPRTFRAFVDFMRYTFIRAPALLILTLSYARRIGIGRDGDDL